MSFVSKVYQVDEQTFCDIVKNANSYSDCLRALGLSTKGGSSTDVLKRRIKELKCDISHFGQDAKKSPYIKYSLDEILVENSPYANIAHLKYRLVKEGYLDYQCFECGITDWRGKTLSLHLDHKNGINNDHRLENLRFLCPNCHSLTDTYAGKNKS